MANSVPMTRLGDKAVQDHDHVYVHDHDHAHVVVNVGVDVLVNVIVAVVGLQHYPRAVKLIVDCEVPLRSDGGFTTAARFAGWKAVK